MDAIAFDIIIAMTSASPPLLSPPKRLPAERPRKYSTASNLSIEPTDSIASSITSSHSAVSSKRQDEFERYFRERLAGEEADLTVIATQSADLQAKLLLHGRLYLTRSHLCFRSNILGYLTESIHPLKDIVSVAKGTTAKWIQNAVYISVQGPDTVEVINYGSLGDREALFEVLVDCWKLAAPERHASWLDEISDGNGQGEEKPDDTATLDGGETGEDVKHTRCSGDHYDEVALDAKFPMNPEQLYELLYRNEQFIREFYETDKELTGEATLAY